MDPNLLNVFVSVVFVNSPTVFRIVRGITLNQTVIMLLPRRPW